MINDAGASFSFMKLAYAVRRVLMQAAKESNTYVDTCTLCVVPVEARCYVTFPLDGATKASTKSIGGARR